MTVESIAPLRLGLAGGGSDVSPYSEVYGGRVVNATINLFCYCTLEPVPGNTIFFEATDRDEWLQAPVQPKLEIDGRFDLHKAVYNRIIHDHGIEPFGFRISTRSDAPAGSGLGSSSTMVVSILNAFTVLLDIPLDSYQLAHLAYSIEREDLGFSGGKQDQYATVFGGFNFIEFNTDSSVFVHPLALPASTIAKLQSEMMLFYTGNPRFSSMIIEDQQASLQQGTGLRLEAMHNIRRDALLIRDHLLNAALTPMYPVIADAWEAKKRTSDSISNAVIDAIYQQAIQAGAWSGKISGAGGGGFMMFFAPTELRDRVKLALRDSGGRFVDFNFFSGRARATKIPDRNS